MRHLILVYLLLASMGWSKADTPVNPVGLSMELLSSVRYNTDVSGILNAMASFTEDELAAGLTDDAAKMTFWLNVYNAMIQHKLTKDTATYVKRNKFFRTRDIVVAGKRLSFDQIEHGLLRRSKVKWSGGYLTKWFPSAFEKRFWVEQLDWRIHFALNCGAMSCPAVQQYEKNDINQQLENATTLFLMFETEYDSTANTFSLPKLFRWFQKDFGGKAGIHDILEKREFIPVGTRPKLIYTAYDWSLSVGNYR